MSPFRLTCTMEEDDDDDGDGGQWMKRSLDSPETSLIGRFCVFFVAYQLPPTLVSFWSDDGALALRSSLVIMETLALEINNPRMNDIESIVSCEMQKRGC